MKMKFDPFIAFECVNAIGNSLDLPIMLTEVITTFMHCTGARAGMYRESPYSAIISVGLPIEAQEIPLMNGSPFYILEYTEGKILQLPLSDGDFLFLFDNDADITTTAMMFSHFRIKLFNAIEACRNVEKLCTMNLNLSNQIDIEKHKNETAERLMIAQSRLAIMGEMIGMIAHQWRQPITVIGMLTNNALLDIELGELKTEQLIGDLQSIDKQVHFLSRTIDDFRNFFRPNKLPQSITLGEIENELITIIGKSFENNRITVLFEGDKEFPLITYKNELLQVFLNILNNSKDAFIENKIISPRVSICLEEENDLITFLVTDNGGGIKPAVLSHIFEPYFTTKSDKNGTGLGLYMSAIIVEKHLKGSLKAASFDTTSTFTITLPKNIDSKGYHVY